jgi:predicted RNA methylase
MPQRLTAQEPFDNIVDAGVGRGRLCMAAARLFSNAHIWAVEHNDDMCAALGANLAAQGLAPSAEFAECSDVVDGSSGRAAKAAGVS